MLKQYLITFFISMVPLIELRLAIPYSQMVGLPLLQSYVVAIIGNMLPVPIIFFFARKVLEWGSDKPVIGKFFTFCLEKGEKGAKQIEDLLSHPDMLKAMKENSKNSAITNSAERIYNLIIDIYKNNKADKQNIIY